MRRLGEKIVIDNASFIIANISLMRNRIRKTKSIAKVAGSLRKVEVSLGGVAERSGSDMVRGGGAWPGETTPMWRSAKQFSVVAGDGHRRLHVG